MRELLSKFQSVTNHPDAPVKLSAAHWKKLLKPHGIDFAKLPDLLKDYLTGALFKKALPLTFNLYSAPYLEKFITEDDWFPAALAGDLFIIGNRDGDFVCVSCKHGGVALTPGWSISEKLFVREKRYKSLETFFRGQLKRETQAAERAAESKKTDAEFAASSDPNAGPNLEHRGGALPLITVMQASHDSSAERKKDAIESAKILLKHGADPDRVGGGAWNTTVLTKVTWGRFFEGMELLLAHGADPNHPAEKNAFQAAEKITNQRMSKRALRILEKAVAG